MNALTSFPRGPRPSVAGAMSVAELWARLMEADSMEARLCREADALTELTASNAKNAEANAWRDEQNRFETALRDRFASFSGGVSLADFAERLS